MKLMQKSKSKFLSVALVSSLVMLSLSVVGLMSAIPASAAATFSGNITIFNPSNQNALNSGGSGTDFGLRLPTGAACSGDSAGGGFRVQSFMTPVSVNASALQFNSSGPIPAGTGTSFRQPLFSSTSSPFVNALTDVATTQGGPGTISNIPVMDFSYLAPNSPSLLPDGEYRLGISCTLGTASTNQLDNYWTVRIVISSSNTDPLGFLWTLSSTQDSGQQATTTTTLAAGTSTTTSTIAQTTTTTTIDPLGGTAPTTVPGSGGPSVTPISSSVGQLPMTGRGTWTILFWAFLAIVFGRMLYLTGKRPKVKDEIE